MQKICKDTLHYIYIPKSNISNAAGRQCLGRRRARHAPYANGYTNERRIGAPRQNEQGRPTSPTLPDRAMRLSLEPSLVRLSRSPGRLCVKRKNTILCGRGRVTPRWPRTNTRQIFASSVCQKHAIRAIKIPQRSRKIAARLNESRGWAETLGSRRRISYNHLQTPHHMRAV